MSKRGASRELNHDNWNEEEEPEEAGNWKPASSQAIQGRVIKQARRRLADSQDEVRFCYLLFVTFSFYARNCCSSLRFCLTELFPRCQRKHAMGILWTFITQLAR